LFSIFSHSFTVAPFPGLGYPDSRHKQSIAPCIIFYELKHNLPHTEAGGTDAYCSISKGESLR